MPTHPLPWTLVVALANNGVIGRNNELPWKLSSDLQRFKAMTLGHCLVMGRKTYTSIGRPLPGRQTIIVSRGGFQVDHPAVTVVSDLVEVNPAVEPGRQVMVVGGAQLYAAALPLCQQLWLTRVLADIDGDTFFPEIDWTEWTMTSSEFTPADARNDWPTEFQIWDRLN
jgi:dihydrofolate reductase